MCPRTLANHIPTFTIYGGISSKGKKENLDNKRHKFKKNCGTHNYTRSDHTKNCTPSHVAAQLHTHVCHTHTHTRAHTRDF